MSENSGDRRQKVFGIVRSGVAYSVIPMVGLITAPIMAQALGPSGRGQLAAILQPLTVAGAFASFGLPAAVTFFVGSGFAKPAVRRTAYRLCLIALLIVCCGLGVYLPTIVEVSRQPFWFVALIWASIIPGALVAIRRSILQAEGVYWAIDAERASSGLLRLLLVAVLFLAGVVSPAPYTAAYTVAGLVAMVWLFVPFRRAGNSLSERVVSAPLFGKFALMSSVGVIATTLNSRLDQAVLPAAMSASALGIYSVAVTIAELPYVMTAVVARNLLTETSKGIPVKQLWFTFALGQGLVIGACGVLMVLSPWIMRTFFGVGFASAAAVAIVLLVSTMFGSAAQCASALLVGVGAPAWSSVAPFTGALITVLGLSFSWASMTPLAAAWIALVAQVTVSVVSVVVIVFVARRGRRIGVDGVSA